MPVHFSRLTALAAVTLTVATAGALTAVPARADDSTPPSIQDVSYSRFVNASETVTFSVTNGTYTPDGAEVGIADSSSREVDATATVTSTSATGYTASATLSTADFPEGDTLFVGIEADDSNGGEGDYEMDGVTATVDRTPPTVSLQPLSFSSYTQLNVVTADNTNSLIKTNCSIDGAPSKSCAGLVSGFGLAPGTHSVSVTATDLAGNSSSATGSVRSWQNTVETATFGSSARFGVGQSFTMHVLSQAILKTGVTPTGTFSVTDNGITVGTTPLTAAGVGLADADVTLKAGSLGSHTLVISYGGDTLSLSSTFTISYTAIPVLRAVIKPGAVSGGKLRFTLSCPASSARCVGFLQLGKSKASYSAYPGRHGSIALALPASTLAALSAHRPVTVKILFADNVKHSALVVHLR